MKVLTQEEVLIRLKDKWGDKIDFSKVQYKNSRSNVIVSCPMHGEWVTTTKKLLNGYGCRVCGYSSVSDKNSKTHEQYVAEVKHREDEGYDLSQVVYRGAHEPITVLCKVHGAFEVTANEFRRGRGCRECSYIYRGDLQVLPFCDFKRISMDVHKGFYKYIEESYTKASDKVTIVCPVHGEFTQNATNHMGGQGCPRCAGNILLTTEEYIARCTLLFGGRYDYSITEYKGGNCRIEYICPVHGLIRQLAKNHLNGWGCSKCAPNSTVSKDELIQRCERVHGKGTYNYDKVVLVNMQSPITVTCPTHGDFDIIANYIASGSGCPRCSRVGTSIVEQNVLQFVSEHTTTSHRDTTNGFEIDVLCPKEKVGIEVDGIYYHSTAFPNRQSLLDKTKLAESEGISMIHVYEDEWNNSTDIVKSMLLSKLGKTPEKVYARSCEVVEVQHEEANLFLNGNHLQGAIVGAVKLGLRANGELVSLMIFGQPRQVRGSESTDGAFEIKRFCSKLFTNVVGGASKLLTYFEKTYLPRIMVSYADKRWSKGELYETLGFTHVATTPPDYYYIVGGKRKHKSSFRKGNLVKQGFDESMSESEIMDGRGYHKIFDCGKGVYHKRYDK